MNLTEREKDKLLIYTASMLAKQRKDKGIELNYPEAVAFITAEVLELARGGRRVEEVQLLAARVLRRKDVMEGVPEMLKELAVDATFPDGSKVVVVRDLFPQQDYIVPGEIIVAPGSDIEINAGTEKKTIKITNNSDRTVFIGSHIHLIETNSSLNFDRYQAEGHRMNIPSGTMEIFSPGEEKEVELTKRAGEEGGAE
ncbi:urease subunit gamma/beta [Serratia marcescens]|nr:urease subunit gamma/beta [Serratia marcescens]